MKSGAFVVCIDNGVEEFIDFAKSLFPKKMFELIHEDKKVALRLNPLERKDALGNYLQLIGKQPRLSTDHAARFIWRKK